MEAIIFAGIQATGKSTFYKMQFFNTHVRINLDMLKTRQRENILLKACIEAQQRFVVDNTNLTIVERSKYILLAKAAKFSVVGYYFQSALQSAVERNESRLGKEKIPVKGLYAAHHKLQIPTFEEGFDTLYYVQLDSNNHFTVEEWINEV